MKRFLAALFLALLILAPCIHEAQATSYAYWATALTGGGAGALDAIDGADLATGDMALVVTSSSFYSYYMDAASGAAESSPTIISPDTNAGNKRWLLKAPMIGGLTASRALQTSAAGAMEVSATVDTTELGYLNGLTGAIYFDGGTDVAIDDGGTGAGTAVDAFTALKQAATDAATGVVELATTGEVAAQADTGRCVTPEGLGAVYLYDTIFIPAGAMVPSTTSGSDALATNETAVSKLCRDYLAFDGGAVVSGAQWSMPMPEGWDLGTVKVKFFWSSATGSTAGDTCEWGIEAAAVSNDDALDVNWGNPQVVSDTLLADNGGDLQLTAATPALTIGGTPALGDLITFKVYRNTTGTDDMAEDGWLFGAWVQYRRNVAVSAW